MNKVKLFCCLGASILALGFVLHTSKPLFAHSRPIPGALSLPACHSRSFACEQPSDPEKDEPDGHCRDGLGVAQFCQSDGPFPYLDLIAIKGQRDWQGVGQGEVNGASFVLLEREPLFDKPCQDGLAGPFPCDSMDLLAFLPIDEIGGGQGSDMWGWTDPETGREYALMGRDNGTSFIDITTPTAPIYLGDLPTQATKSPWRDLKVYKDHVFVVADFNRGHGMQVFDLTQLRDVITSTAIITPAIFTPTAHYDEFSRAHNIAINEESGYAYAVGSETCNAGPHTINIQDPIDPQFAGCYEEDEYTHDAQCVYYRGPDLAYNDREICFNSNVDTLTIVDMTDKESPQMLTKVGSTDFKYVHQSWLSEDQRYMLSDDELDEIHNKHNTRTYIWDVSDLQNPTIIGVHESESESVDHNLYVRGNYLFEANYTSGLRIFDLANVADGKLTEVAYLDTFPEVDESTTGGAWSVYPYYQSGVVAVSSIEDGLFVLRPHLPPEFSAKTTDNMLGYCMVAANTITTGAVMINSSVLYTDALQLAAYNNYSGTIQLRVEPPDPNIVLSRTQAIFSGNGNTTFDIELNPTSFSEGSHSFQISLSDSVSTTTLAYEFGLHSAVPDVVTFAPDGGTTTMPGFLSWPATVGALDYLVEISTERDFRTIVYAERTRSTQIPAPALLENGRYYYFRVQASNACGASVFSDVSVMRTGVAVYMPLIQ